VGAGSVTVRARVAADLPVLVDLLSAQQPASGYPVRWPLPFPVEEFVARRGELGAWVAEVDGTVVGHVAVLDVVAGWEADAWCAALDRPREGLASVSVLFVDPGSAGRGVGRTLLATAVAHARALGRTPVLDVVASSAAAVGLYRRTGWVVVGETAPEWLPPGRGPFLLMALPEDPSATVGACQR
jgi:GNAT superfamily N-acetyltransferase